MLCVLISGAKTASISGSQAALLAWLDVRSSRHVFPRDEAREPLQRGSGCTPSHAEPTPALSPCAIAQALVASVGRELSLCLRDQPPQVTGRHCLWTAANPLGSATRSTQVARTSASARGVLQRAANYARAEHKKNPAQSLTWFCPGDNPLKQDLFND